jgi:hypothetical protein
MKSPLTRFKSMDLALTRKFAVSVVLSALLTQPSYAQPFPESERQKAEEARKKTDEKATDEAYKSLMKHLPATNKKVDPWEVYEHLRQPPASKLITAHEIGHWPPSACHSSNIGHP